MIHLHPETAISILADRKYRVNEFAFDAVRFYFLAFGCTPVCEVEAKDKADVATLELYKKWFGESSVETVIMMLLQQAFKSTYPTTP